MSISPFVVDIPQPALDDLHQRLEQTRWPDQIRDAQWDYGTNLEYLRDLVGHWQSSFDWRAQETEINRFPHFKAGINGLDIHFIHQRGNSQNQDTQSIPLLLMHGWPSSFVQMLKIIPLLATSGEGDTTFDVVAVSLPGYGFSDRPTERGMSVARMAAMFHTLMADELGYSRYAVRGSDLGAGVASQLAVHHPDAIIGMHTGGTNPWIQDVPDDLSEAEQTFVENAQRWNQEEMAYAMIHATKPQTLSYALNDSPVGLAAWIIEKFRRWSDNDGDVESAFARDELLTNLTIYWVTETIGSSMRLYYETMRDPGDWGTVNVPTGAAMPAHDMFPTPREWVERTSPVDRWTKLPRGGHFPEWEVPELMADDIRAFFRTLRET